MKNRHALLVLILIFITSLDNSLISAPFDAAPFGIKIENGQGVMWEDPREIHRIVVYFKNQSQIPENLVLQYWGSRWPQQRLPKDREPGGGDVGWMELGNWHQYGWRIADAIAQKEANRVIFTFNPVNKTEFPGVKNYPATFRYTLKIRVVAKDSAPLDVDKIEAFTDSELVPFKFRVTFEKETPENLIFEVYNGLLKTVQQEGGSSSVFVEIDATQNTDPNTFDKTLVTIRGKQAVTFKVEDLKDGEIYIPFAGLAVLNGNDRRRYSAVEKDVRASGKKSLYNRVSELSEQTWRAAWDGMPPKKSHIYFPMGMDGGRQRFRLNANGSVEFRTNDGYLERRPGKDTPRLSLERAPVSVNFSLPNKPVSRTIDDASIPICRTTWSVDDFEINQIAFVTLLDGVDSEMDTPEGDTFAVCMLRFAITNRGNTEKVFTLPVNWFLGDKAAGLKAGENNFIFANDRSRFHLTSDAVASADGNT
ncbi:MAG: hypothetical protein N2487_04175, partial [Verrucomicrobiae bacterium]|nr:hypothetical protein [Verrucomicrobiae bacterium]